MGCAAVAETNTTDAARVAGFAKLFADADTYYMGADLGAAYEADEYRGPSMVRNVLKAPFVALWQTGKALVRIPGATIENAKHDPWEAILQAAAVAAMIGNETEWFGLEGHDERPKGRSEQYNQGGMNIGPPPPDQGSYQEVHVTRDQGSVVTSSSKDVDVITTFGSSGSSQITIKIRDAGGFDSEEE